MEFHAEGAKTLFYHEVTDMKAGQATSGKLQGKQQTLAIYSLVLFKFHKY